MQHKVLNKIIPGSRQKPLLLDLFLEKNHKKKPLLIFVHGFKGFKDWGHFNLMAEFFARNNFAFAKFNFSYNGTTPADPLNFSDLDAFGNNNYVTELDDLGLIIDYFTSNSEFAEEIDSEKIYLLGHSRGGGIAVLKSAEDKRIKKLVTWAAVSSFLDRNRADTIKEWQQKGVVYTFNGRTKQQMPLYYQFYESLQQNRSRLNIAAAAQALEIPFLIIHGKKDEAVSFKDAEELHACSPHSKLLAIEGGNHTFGAVHPWTNDHLPSPAGDVIQKTLEFLQA